MTAGRSDGAPSGPVRYGAVVRPVTEGVCAVRVDRDDVLLRPRRGGPTLNVIMDVIGQARVTRNWIVLILIVAAAAAAAAAFFGQTVLPWAIYPAL